MTNRFLKSVLYLILFFTSSASLADMAVAVIDESKLPYEFSPSNYENSPSNYDNSISNYDNSASNYDNSESNYENSSSNYDNSSNGKRRLIDSNTFVGYHVTADNGTTNFFSPSGKRMFYNPKKGRGVFGGKDGTFCGVVAVIDGKLQLVLTENGVKILLLNN